MDSVTKLGLPDSAYETRARGALRFGMSNPGRVLIEYLRSDQPITREFRDDLAAAIAGTLEDGVTVEFPGTGPLSPVGIYETRMKWLKLARDFYASGLTQEKFRYSGKWDEEISKSKLEEALRFYKEFEGWFSEAKDTDPKLVAANQFAIDCGRNDLDYQLQYFGFMMYSEMAAGLD